MPTLARSEAKTDIKGTFSAQALRSFGTGDNTNADKQLAEAEEQTELLRSLDNRVRDGGGLASE